MTENGTDLYARAKASCEADGHVWELSSQILRDAYFSDALWEDNLRKHPIRWTEGLFKGIALLVVGAGVGLILSGLIGVASTVVPQPVGPDSFPTMQEGYALCQERGLEFTAYPDGQWVCAEAGTVTVP